MIYWILDAVDMTFPEFKGYTWEYDEEDYIQISLKDYDLLHSDSRTLYVVCVCKCGAYNEISFYDFKKNMKVVVQDNKCHVESTAICTECKEEIKLT